MKGMGYQGSPLGIEAGGESPQGLQKGRIKGIFGLLPDKKQDRRDSHGQGRYNRTIFERYVIDDGWNLLVEVVEAIGLRIRMAWQDAYRKVCGEHKLHQRGWLTEDVVRRFAAKAWIYLELHGYQYVAEVWEISRELQEGYGVTELEAINILNGRNVRDYLDKYYRIRHKIPFMVDEQAICDGVVDEYMSMAM